MDIKNSKNYIYIFIVFLFVSSLFLFKEYNISNHQYGFPLDDSWIHIRYAENIANGYLFNYNIGDATPGTTSPLWAIILSIPFFFSPNLYLQFTLFACSLFFLLACIEVYKLCLQLGFSPKISLLAGLLTVLCGRLVWSSLSGMEITLFCYLILLITRLHLIELKNGKVKAFTGLLLGLSVIARPESYLFAIIYYAVTLILLRNNLKNNIKYLSISLLLFLIISVPYPIFCFITTGGFFPNTFRVQNTSIKPDIEYFKEAGIMFFKDNLIIVILILEGLYYFIESIFIKKIDKNLLLVNLWIILLPAVFSFIAPNLHHHGRYLMPLIPFVIIGAIYIFLKRFTFFRIENQERYKKQVLALSVIMIIFSLLGAISFSKTLGTDTKHINNQQVRVAYWLNTNLPDEKSFGTHDIGAISFITKKKIFDMEGLVNPEVLKIKKLPPDDRNKEMMKLLKINGVNYIIIYPQWFPGLLDSYSQYFEKIYSVQLDEGVIAPAYEMIVFKIHWEDIKLN